MSADHTTQPLDLDDEPADEVAMTPRAIQTRAEMAHEWAASRAVEGILPWSVRQHFGEDMTKLIETVIRLKQEKDEQLDLGAELLMRLLEAKAEVERLRALLGQTTAALNVALSLAIPRAERNEDDQQCIEGCREALRQAVDALDTAGTAPAAGGEAGR